MSVAAGLTLGLTRADVPICYMLEAMSMAPFQLITIAQVSIHALDGCWSVCRNETGLSDLHVQPGAYLAWPGSSVTADWPQNVSMAPG